MSKKAINMKKQWQEVHPPLNALRADEIEPGGIYRTLRLGRTKEKGKLNYQYGVVKLCEGSTTQIDISFNLSTTDRWDAGGSINPDNGHVSFFPPRAEHISMVNYRKESYRLTRELQKLHAELDFNKALLDDKCSEISKLEDDLHEIRHRCTPFEKVAMRIDRYFDWVLTKLNLL